MLVIGLTGGIGCGKSVVSDIFHQAYDMPVIDADIIARELSNTSHVSNLIRKELGAKYFDNHQVLQRDKLRQAVFTDANIRVKLENILHPLVYQEIKCRLEALDAVYCIVVIPLLLETKRTNIIDHVLVVDCTVEEQIHRVMLRDQCSEAHVKAIIATQVDRDMRLSLANDVIENHGNIESLRKKIAILHKKFSIISKK